MHGVNDVRRAAGLIVATRRDSRWGPVECRALGAVSEPGPRFGYRPITGTRVIGCVLQHGWEFATDTVKIDYVAGRIQWVSATVSAALIGARRWPRLAIVLRRLEAPPGLNPGGKPQTRLPTDGSVHGERAARIGCEADFSGSPPLASAAVTYGQLPKNEPFRSCPSCANSLDEVSIGSDT